MSSHEEIKFNVLHLFSGIGGAALGMQNAEFEWRGIQGKFITLAGIDNDEESCRDFEKITGAPAVQKDMFSRKDYIDFHGHEPPDNWKEVKPEDLVEITKGTAPDVVFLSAPCKGFSGLLPSKSAKSAKYQALNRLTVRGIWLTVEAFKDNLPGIILFENVPRITSRGTELLNEIKAMLSAYGYLFHEGSHDCGQIGGLGQHRKRYLLIARHPEKVSSFVYKPPKYRVKTIGEVLGKLPLPDDEKAGTMHRLPRLQWKTWVRLALIPPGGDWRDLENIEPGQYRLEYIPRSGAFKVGNWDEPASTVIGSASVRSSNGMGAISDPRLPERQSRHPGVYRVVRFDETGPCVTGTRFGSGAPAIADPRVSGGYSNKRKVLKWDETATTVTGTPDIQSGAQSIADPRTGFKKSTHHAIYKIRRWNEPAGTITGAMRPNNGAISIEDPRLGCKCRNGLYGVQDWNQPGYTVTGARNLHSGTNAVADPRIPDDQEKGVWIIIAEDGTWHRPLTTLELAALQGFPVTYPDGSPLVLEGRSDARWRERIGNAVPPAAAAAIGEQILKALITSMYNALELSATPIWVDKTKTEIKNIFSQ